MGVQHLRVFFTPIRVVCANTLGLAERRGRGQGVSVIHKGDLAAKVGEAQKILGLATRFYDSLEDRINQLANHYPSRQQLTTYFERVYPDKDGAKNKRAENVRSELFRLFEEGQGTRSQRRSSPPGQRSMRSRSLWTIIEALGASPNVNGHQVVWNRLGSEVVLP